MFARPRQRQRFRGIGGDPSLKLNLLLTTSTLPSGLVFSRASAATDVINGVLTNFASGQPRISATNGYLPENQATNSVQNSNKAATASTVTLGNAVGPDGVDNSADTWTIDTSSVSHFLNVPTATQTNTTYTVSAFVKVLSGPARVQLAVSGSFSAAYANFGLTGLGSVLSSGGGLVSAGIVALANGWYRIHMVYTSGAGTNTPLAMWMIPTNTATRAATYTGNGTDALLVYGFQAEQGEGVTSYIPTTTAAATRAADNLYKDMTGIANVSEGTLFAQVRDAEGATGGLAKYTAALSDGSEISNSALLVILGANAPNSQVYSGSVKQADISSATYSGVRLKHAIGYKLNDVITSANGVLGTKDTAATMPVTLNRLDIGNRPDGTRAVNGYVETVRYYNKRKTDAELQAMTA